MIVRAGSTDVTTYFVLRLAATGVEATGLTITNFDLQYTRSGVAPTAKVDAVALAATDTAHTDNRAIEVDATDQPGVYRVDWPDAAFAAGVREVILTVKCATVFTESLRVELNPAIDVVAISGDTDAADNAELMFDGTGYAGGTAKLSVNLATDLYHADIQFTRDQANTTDEFSATWFKNGVRQTSGITSPTIQVVKRVDGTDLVASTAMTQVGSTGTYKYDEATNRITVGEAVIVVVGATIDSAARSFSRLIGRDSS